MTKLIRFYNRETLMVNSNNYLCKKDIIFKLEYTLQIFNVIRASLNSQTEQESGIQN